MNAICTTAQELDRAIKDKRDSIMVVGDFKNKVLAIKIVGKAAWGFAAASLTVAITCYIATPEVAVMTAPAGGAGGALTFTGGMAATAVAATTLGSAVGPALAIGIAAGGIGVLNTLRDRYKIVEKNSSYLVLKRK